MSLQNPIFIPGPTNIPERLRHAMNVPTQDHRAPDFSDTFLPVLADAKKYLAPKRAKSFCLPQVAQAAGKRLSAILYLLVIKYSSLAMVCSLIAGSICVSVMD